MGLQPFPYLVSIFVLQVVSGLLTSLVICGVGVATRLPFFAYCNFAVLVLVFWLLCMSVSSYALFLGSWIHRPSVNCSSLFPFAQLLPSVLTFSYAVAAFMVISFLFAVIFAVIISFSFGFQTFWLDESKFTQLTSALSYPANLGTI